jgi:hypothetical protein
VRGQLPEPICIDQPEPRFGDVLAVNPDLQRQLTGPGMAMPTFQKAFRLEMSHDGFGTLSAAGAVAERFIANRAHLLATVVRANPKRVLTKPDASGSAGLRGHELLRIVNAGGE